jgi:hypothetical protein
LVDNQQLGECFREKFIRGLRRLFERSELKLEGVWSALLNSDHRDTWIGGLEAIDWNVFIEGPPNGKSDPKHVLMYLARYMTGGPIADSRLIRQQEDKIVFWARSKDKRRGNRQEEFPLKCIEFVRRWAMHILPKGFTKTRRYGGFSGSQHQEYLERCQELLSIEPAAAEASPAKPVSDGELLKCLRCQCELECIQATRRPSWREVFERLYSDHSIYSPIWHVACYSAGPTYSAGSTARSAGPNHLAVPCDRSTGPSARSPAPWQPDG